MEFINLTTSTGNFELATEFLNSLPSDNEEVKTEKARVLIASGKSLPAQNPVTATTSKAKYTNAKTNKNVPVLPTPGMPSTTSIPSMQAPFYGMTPGASANALPPKPYVPATTTSAPVHTEGKYAPPSQPSMASPFVNKTNSSTRLNSFAPPPNPYATATVPATNVSTTSIQQNALLLYNLVCLLWATIMLNLALFLHNLQLMLYRVKRHISTVKPMMVGMICL